MARGEPTVNPKEAKKVDVTVRIGKADVERFDEIVAALQQGGLADLQPHKRFGIVNGSVSVERIEALAVIRGVASVREDQDYKAQ
jgi:hypothetical protein